MKKEEIYVLIDSEEKRLRAIQILNDAGEKILDKNTSMDFSEKFKNLRLDINGYWFVFGYTDSCTQITLDQLEEMMMPKHIEGDVFLCLKDFVMNDGSVEYTKDKKYIYNKYGYLTNDSGNSNHFLGTKNMSEYFKKVEKDKIKIELHNISELTFPREMLVSEKGESFNATIIGKVQEFWIDISGDSYLIAEEIPNFETEVQKLAESFGVKVNELKYESKK